MFNRRRTIVLSTVAALVIGVAAGGWRVFFARPPVNDATPGDILVRYGYREIRPASTLSGPGSINVIDHVTSTYLMLHRACIMNMKEIEEEWANSPTIGESLGEELNGQFDIPTLTLAMIKATAGYDKIRNVTISFSNTNILQLDEESLFNIRQKYFTGNCATIIRDFYRRAICVTQPYEVLKSDITYTIDYQSSVSSDDKAKIANKIKGTLDIDAKMEDVDKISGKDVFIGIKMSEVCIVPNEENARLLTVSDIERREREETNSLYHVKEWFQGMFSSSKTVH